MESIYVQQQQKTRDTVPLCNFLEKFYTRIRAVMLDAGMKPYTDVADLFVIDPDGFIIR